LDPNTRPALAKEVATTSSLSQSVNCNYRKLSMRKLNYNKFIINAWIIANILVVTACENTTRTFYDNGNIKEEYKVVNGLIQGNYLLYDNNGGLKKKSTYINDTLNGLTVRYNEIGEVTDSGYYLKGKLNGYYKSFTSRTLTKKVIYDNGDTLNFIEFNKDGDILNAFNYILDWSFKKYSKEKNKYSWMFDFKEVNELFKDTIHFRYAIMKEETEVEELKEISKGKIASTKTKIEIPFKIKEYGRYDIFIFMDIISNGRPAVLSLEYDVEITNTVYCLGQYKHIYYE
jgi:hypothetical protein